jgi:hypothetical protein
MTRLTPPLAGPLARSAALIPYTIFTGQTVAFAEPGPAK